MTRELKKCYYYLDLSFNATVEQVKTQEKILIKILRAKALKKGVSQKKKIDKIVYCANMIEENIIKNGIPNFQECRYVSTGKELAMQLFVFAVVSVIAIISYLSLV